MTVSFVTTTTTFFRGQGFWLGADMAGFVSYIPPLNGAVYRPGHVTTECTLMIPQLGKWA